MNRKNTKQLDINVDENNYPKSRIKEWWLDVELYLLYRNWFVKLCRKISKSVKNLIVWFPIIWKDRNWDEDYLLEIIGFKLKQMSKFHKKHGFSVEADSVAEELKKLSKLVEKITNDDYNSERMEELVNKVEFSFSEKDSNGMYTLKSTGLTNEESKEMLNLEHELYKLKRKDLDRVFDTMKERIEYWWD